MATPNNLFDRNGTPITLASQLGEGGEGIVYDLHLPFSGQVAKIYHKPITGHKQKKLIVMAASQNSELTSIAAWPINSVHAGRNGAIVGLIMPKITGYEEIHSLYGPAHRRNEFPSADWAFLVQAARNVSAAVATVHNYGHVIGDINPGNIAISQAAMAKLIDCDSFQINAGGELFLCEVGVPHFTSPELHGQPLDKIKRTSNHDAFGLALMCFHLLFMGRHPFAGRFSGTGEMPLAKSIREHRFAYSTSAAKRQMSPPPNSLPLSILPPALAQMFEAAFGEQGVMGHRPSAIQWVKALEQLKSELISCVKFAWHKYHRALSTCPWCWLETQSNVIFFLPPQSLLSAFDVNQTWAKITSISPAGVAPLPSFTFSFPPALAITRLDIPSSARSHRRALNDELRQLTEAHKKAEQGWQKTVSDWNWATSDDQFQTKLTQLQQSYMQYVNLGRKFVDEKNRLQLRSREIQLNAYLDRCYIEKGRVTGIGPTRAATLAAYGIETAADITEQAILAVPGFGPTLTLELVSWRRYLESRFVFDPKKAISVIELAKLQQQFAAQMIPLEQILSSGAGELKLIKSAIQNRRQTQQLSH